MEQNPVRFRNAMKRVEELLGKAHPRRRIDPLLEKLRRIEGNGEFWRHQLDGLALFCSKDVMRTAQLQRPTEEMVIVAGSFHVKPLIRKLQSADRYQVLCVTPKNVSLYEGNRYRLDPVELCDVPRNITEALGEEVTEPHLTVASYGGVSGPGMRHGHGSKKDEQDVDMERYLRVIDRAVWENHSRRSGIPMLLAAAEEQHPVFHKMSHNPHLLEEGIRVNPDVMDTQRLREEAWRVIEPQVRRRAAKAVDRFRTAEAQQGGSDDLVQIAEAAAFGRVAMLLVESGRRIGGSMDLQSGRVEFKGITQPGVDDLLDDIAEQVLRTEGEVLIIDRQRMPTASGAAAIYRF